MLEFRNVSYSVAGKDILKNINLTIDDRFVAITGPNGSGKSTMAKLIAGIIKPTEGSILMDGVDITDLSITERAKAGISFAFQQPVRFKGITVRDLISLAAGKSTSIAEACSYLSEVGLCATVTFGLLTINRIATVASSIAPPAKGFIQIKPMFFSVHFAIRSSPCVSTIL